jgi:endonuclease/exonuclease/phosphatase family metal-dependent hydrolase
MTTHDGIVVGTLNVWGRWADWPARRRSLRAAWPDPGPDVLLLQEVRRDEHGHQAEEIADLLGYPCVFAVAAHEDDHGAEGLAILARRPLHRRRTDHMPTSMPARLVLLAEVEVGAGAVTVACAHTIAVPDDVRAGQVDTLLARDEDPLVLGADLNDTPDAIGPLARRAGLIDALKGDTTPTWPLCHVTFGEAWRSQLGRAPHFSLAPRRLDYLFCRGMDVRAAGVDPLELASDHALVWADVTLTHRAVDPDVRVE